MRASTQRIYVFLLSLFCFVASFVVYALLLKPAYADLNMLRGILSSKTEALDVHGQIALKVKDLIANYKGVQNLQENISLALPKEQSLATLYNQFYALASDTNLNLKSLSAGAGTLRATSEDRSTSQTPAKVGTVQVTLTLAGTYEAFRNFLEKLETNIRILDVASFTVAAPQGQSRSANSFDFTAIVVAYYQSR